MAYTSQLQDVWIWAEQLLIHPGIATGQTVEDPLSHLDEYL